MPVISPPQLAGLMGLDLISILFLLYTLKCNYNTKYCERILDLFSKSGGLLLLLPFSLKITIFQSSVTKLIPESPPKISGFPP